MQQGSKYLKRGKGKTNTNVGRADFYKYYKNNAEEPYTRKEYDRFITELFKQFGEAMVNDSLILNLKGLGIFRVMSFTYNPIDQEGKIKKSNKPNWQRTFEYWHKKYPDLTRDEILNLDEKLKVIYHDNDHSNNEVCKFVWKPAMGLTNKKNYTFSPTRALSRMLAKELKNPIRKTFYYGRIN